MPVADARKDAERDYPHRVGDDGRRWLETKPFGGPTRETSRHLIDTGYVIELLALGPDRPGGPLRTCELGCGSGWLSIFLARAGADATGLDISPEMVRIARERAAREQVAARFDVADMEELPAGLDGSFDACVLYEALHHSPDPAAVLAGARRLLAPGGAVVLVEPNWKHRYEGRTAARTYGVTEMGFSARRLKRELRSAGFVDVERFHNNRKRLFGNGPADIAGHLAEPLVYRLLAPFWTATWLRARVP